ncbi:MAG: S9 family peptidase [Candidatus Eremiobacteraeota bacterium]|nr:S9 family peptidase [Candidatus Eremiobacteraeota bacterium]
MKRIALTLTALTMASIARPCLAAAPAPTVERVLQASRAVRPVGALQLSPDGKRLVYRVGSGGGMRTSELFVDWLAGGNGPTRLTAGDGKSVYDESDPVWSPDGTKIAFLSDARSSGQLQIYVCSPGGANVTRAGNLSGNVQALRWSPDGKQLSVLYIAGAHRQAGAQAPGARDVGVAGSVVDEQRIAVVAPSPEARTQFVTPAGDYVYEYDWSPDSHAFAFTYAVGNGDDNWWIAKLATIGAEGSGMRDVLAPSYQIDAPRWSPDGKTIAIIGGLMSDFGSTGGDVYLVDANSGTAVDATPNARLSARSLQWIGAGELGFSAIAGGAMQLERLDTATLTSTPRSFGPVTINSWSVANGGKALALAMQSFDQPPGLWIGSLNSEALAPLENVNGASRYWGKAQSLVWKSDSFDVQGWLIYPNNFDPAKTYAMVTVIHGGPAAASLPSYGNAFVSALSSQGFFVFMPNPRGSFGEGEAFTRGNVKDFGYGDWHDDLAGIDTALKAAPIDPQRLGLFGWSYGGYMGMWAETQSTRFKAIVAGAGIVNWQSYYGQNKIDQWMLPFFGASVYDDPAVYAKSSPITFIKQSKTPVLILQGELDEEVPAPQAFEFWHAMKTLGVPTELMVYAGEGHSPQKPADQIDVLTRTLAWFEKYLR